MSILVCNPGRDFVNSLGIPVDNLTLSSAVARVISMAKATDGNARLVSTLNVDFLVNSLGTAFSKPRHPELLEVLRSSDLVTADGFPIIWLSRLLGRPLPERVCGSDMVPAIADQAAREGLSLFLLGGAEGVAAKAAATLVKRYPGLKIAGTAAPFVNTAGAALATAAENDERLVAEIHASDADILLVGLGNPKQELWFNRNRSQLKTPVSIGVGGTFEFITGATRRAPALWRTLNLEWVYRIMQDPARLWRRYAIGLGKLAVLTTPVLWARICETLSPTPCALPGSTGLPWRRLWSSREQSIALLELPSHLGKQYLESTVRELSSGSVAAELKILDFSKVRHIALAAQQELFNLAALLRTQRSSLQLMGMSRRVRQQLSAARVIDLLEGDTRGALQRLTERSTNGSEFSCDSYALGNASLVMLSGRVNRENLSTLGFVECLLHSVRDRCCIIDFRNVDLLESSGIAELLPLFNREQQDQVLLSGVGHSVKQMLRMTEIENNASLIDDSELLALITKEHDHG
ncbi:MAG: WecB/TagA/CpsF family glycosyltransferase [Pseudomonadota bacterium]